MSTKLDLPVCRELIDAKFENYKLSLDPLPVYKSKLDFGPHVVQLSEDQYSYQHSKLFGVHNHLILDPYVNDCIYYVDKNRRILRSKIQGKDIQDRVEVFQITDSINQTPTSGSHNISLNLPSEDLAVFTNGAGSLSVVSTGSRQEGEKWKAVFTSDVLDGKTFFLLDSILYSTNEMHCIDCLLTHVEEATNEQKEEYRSNFLAYIEWVTLQSVDKKNWTIERRRQLIGGRPFDYAALDGSGSALYLASDAQFKFVSDSLKPVIQYAEASNESGDKQTEDRLKYTWSQADEDITAQFTVPPGVTKADLYLTLTHDTIDFGVKNSYSMLKGVLVGHVDVTASTWTIEGQRVELVLSKSSPENWSEVVVDDCHGEMTLDPEQIAQIHERLAHLTSEEWNPDPNVESQKPYNVQQLEECDVLPEDTAVLLRIDGDSHLVTHEANVSSQRFLFNVWIEGGKPQALCLQYDVDGLVWQPQNEVSDLTPPWKHTATFNAFGYVQASKQQRKFSTCPPDCSYAVICDCSRHVYIYRQPMPISSPLRNRKTGHQVDAVAKQQLVTLDTVDNILGVKATNEQLFILTEHDLLVVQVNSAQ
ncbi:hypothetical protein ScPMuIL_001667 [Solemya velum]